MSTLNRTRQVLVIGSEVDYPPYSFTDEQGQATGFNVELAHAIAQVMGLSVEVRVAPWNQVRSDLADGQIDLVAGMYFSEERNRTARFSPPFTVVHHGIFARKGTPAVASETNLYGKSLIVMHGDIMHDYVLQKGVTKDIVLVSSQADALRLLASGKHDYALLAKLPGLHWVQKLGLDNIITTGPVLCPSRYCFAAQEGRDDLIDTFSEGLAILKATGKYKELYDRWLGVYEPETSWLRTAVQYLGGAVAGLLATLALVFLWSKNLKRQVAAKTTELQRELLVRQEAEELLRQSHEELQAICSGVVDGMLITEVETQKIQRVNSSLCAMLGHSEQALLTLSIADIHPPEAVLDDLARFRAAAEGRVSLHQNRPVLRKDGSVFYADITTQPVLYGGRPCVQALFRDISERKQTEEALRQSQERSQFVAERAQVGYWHWDIATDHLEWSATCKRLFGIPENEEMAYGRFLAAVHPEDREETDRAVRACLEGDGNTDFDSEYRVQWPDGSIRWIHAKGSATHSDGRPVRMAGIALDATQSKMAEQSLRESEKRFRSFVEATTQVVWWTNPRGEVDMAIPAWQAYTGQSADEARGFGWMNAIREEDRERVAQAWQTAFDTGGRYEVEYLLRIRDGSWRNVLARGVPVRNSDGTVREYIGVCIDITERKQAEDGLRESESRFRTLANNISQLAWMADPKGVIFWYNERWYDYTGTTLGEMQGLGWKKVHHPEHVGRVVEKLLRCFETGEVWEDTFPLRSRDGSYRWFLSRAVPIRDEQGSILRWFGTNTDISQQKAAEAELAAAKAAAEAASVAKSEFLANMSHELRTPMTAILGFAELLLGEEGIDRAPPARVEAVHTIQRNGQHLLCVINDLLDLSKIEAGKQDLDLQPCSPRQIAREVIDTMRVRADAKGLLLSAECSEDVPDKVQSDPVRLRQILVNLLGNAIKFTEIGSVRMVVQRADQSDERALRFDIIDTGIGVAKEHLVGLFKPFSQVDGSAQRRFGGTGLGLAISKRLAGMLGGDIVVSSVAGKGSTFSVTVATEKMDEDRRQEHSVAPVKPGEVANRHSLKVDCRILLAEDGPDNQRLFAFLLRKAGADVTVVGDGQKAVEQVIGADPQRPFDVILMDMQMPIMDGYEATGKLRELGYERPIIALTAHAMTEDRQKCLDAGCDDYVAKPVDGVRLLQLIAQYAQEHRADKAPRAVV